MTLRWTPEHLEAFEQRRKRWEEEGTVRTHSLGGSPEKAHKRGGRKLSGVETFKRIQRRSRLESALLNQMEAERIPTPHCEYKPLEHRKFRLDFAWPDRKIGIEVQGMVHRIKARFKADIEKRAELLLAGWKVMEADGDSIRDGRALAWVKRLLA